MATLKDFTFTIHDKDGNAVDFSQSQTTQIIRLLPNLVQGLQLGSRELFDAITTHINSAISGDSVYHVSVRKLLDMVETVQQRELMVNNVAKLLVGDYGFLKGHPLYSPLVIGHVKDDEYSNDGGRHRLAAFITLLKGYGFADEWILDATLPAIILKHNPIRIITDNTARGVTGWEKSGIAVSMQGINANNPKEVWKAFTEGNLEGTSSAQRSNAMRLTFVGMTNNNDAGLTAETRGKIATALPGAFSKAFDGMGYALKDHAFLVKLMAFASENLSLAVTRQKQAGVTNLARATTQIAYTIINELRSAVKEGKVRIPDKPKAEPKVKASKEAKSEEKPATRSSTKKRVKKEESAPVDKGVEVAV